MRSKFEASVSADGHGGKMGSLNSSSLDHSFVKVGSLVSNMFIATRHIYNDSSTYSFCYVCRFPNIRRKINDVFRSSYRFCFFARFFHQKEYWVPHKFFIDRPSRRPQLYIFDLVALRNMKNVKASGNHQRRADNVPHPIKMMRFTLTNSPFSEISDIPNYVFLMSLI